MNPSFYRRDRTNQEMDSSLTASLFLLSVVFMQFVSAADPTNIQATAGDNVILPCIDPDPGKITFIEWKRTDLGSEYVLRYRDDQINRHPSYQNRVDLNDKQMKDGDASLILKDATIDDSGTYECRVAKTNIAKPINTVRLVVAPPPEPIPVWAKVLLVLLVLALVAAPVLILWLWYRFSVHQVEVKPGVESVLLPWRWGDQLVSCRSTARLPGDVRVEWRDGYNRKVHVYQNGSDQPGEQNQRYRTRTKMDENLNLTLKRPTCEDNGTYTCRVYRDGDRDVLMEKDVWLKVKVHQVEVKSVVKSVLLSCRTTEDLDGDVRVEWRDGDDEVVHVYQNGSNQPEEQDPSYKGRTKMDGNLQENKNLSLTLMDPTISDTFTCRVSRGQDVLMVKQVQLEVKAHQVEVEEGAGSVKLEFKVTSDLHKGDRVEWKDNKDRIVHMELIGSDQPVEQHPSYKDRTRMNENALETKDLSLILDRPTEMDSRWFRCGVYRNGDWLRIKTFEVNIKAGTDQVQPEETRMSLIADQSV